MIPIEGMDTKKTATTDGLMLSNALLLPCYRTISIPDSVSWRDSCIVRLEVSGTKVGILPVRA